MLQFCWNSPALNSSLTVLKDNEQPLTMDEMDRLLRALNAEAVRGVLEAEFARTQSRSPSQS